MDELSDSRILELIRAEESRRYGFDLLVRTYQQKIYWLVRRMVISHDTADDIVQEVFLKVWENISSFRGQSSLYTWIYRVAVNECLSFLRKERIRTFIPFIKVEKRLAESMSEDPYFDGEEIHRKLQKALRTLPAKQKLVFHMRYYDEMKYEEISAVLGTSVGALKASYHLAAKKIEKYLDEH